MTFGQSSPVDEVDRLGASISSIADRVADIERLLGARVAAGDHGHAGVYATTTDLANTNANVAGKVSKSGDSVTGSVVMVGDAAHVVTRVVRTNNGQSLLLVAGEAINANPAANVNAESIYAIAEDGFDVWGSTSNGAAWSDFVRWFNVNDGALNLRGLDTSTPAVIRFRGSDGGNDIGTMLDFYAGAYTMGVRGSTLFLRTDNTIDFDVGGNTRALVASNGDVYAGLGSTGRLRVSNNNGACEIGPANSTYCHMYTDRGIWYFDTRINVDSGQISSHNENMTLMDSGTAVMVLDAADNANGSVLIYQGNNTSYTNAGQKAGLRIVSRSSGSEATGGLSGFLCQTTFSTDRHVHGRVFWQSGDVMTWRNYENTAWVGHQASAYTVSSSQVGKQRIRTGRDERGVLDFALAGPRRLAFAQARKLRPVLFDDEVQERLREWAGCPAGEHKSRDECLADAEAPRDERIDCAGADNMVEKLHKCDEYICGGTNARPCWLVEQHVDRPGLVAEEVLDVHPKAVTRNADGSVVGIDYAVLTVELINTVQHMLEDRDEARAREARNTSTIRRQARRIAGLERDVDDLADRLDRLEAQRPSTGRGVR